MLRNDGQLTSGTLRRRRGIPVRRFRHALWGRRSLLLESLEDRRLLASGDFSLDFVGSAPESYDHSTGGGAYDDRTIGVSDDVVESLLGGQFACFDRATYLTAITVNGGAFAGAQSIEVDLVFDADATGQSGAGIVDLLSADINYGEIAGGIGEGPGGTDLGIDDDRGSSATIVSESLSDAPYTSGAELLVTVGIDDLEPGESVVLRMDVLLGCDPNTSPTGNVAAKLDDARVVGPVSETGDISGGAQTIPIRQIGDIEEQFPPEAADDTDSTLEDTSVVTNVLANDTDMDGNTLTVSQSTDGDAGTTTVNPDGTITYTPDADFNGQDSFTYVADDGTTTSNQATLTITVEPVNDSPVAIDDFYVTAEDMTLTIPGPGVLANDSDIDSASLIAVPATDVAHGSLQLGTDGGFVYTPEADFSGQDAFTYAANDGTDDSNVATVSITVVSVNDPPLVDSNSHTIPEETLNFPVGLNRPTDADGDPLTITVTGLPTFLEGTFKLDGGAFLTVGKKLTGDHLESLLFDAAPNFFGGPIMFEYAVSDGSVTVTGSSRITVTSLNDPPVVDSNEHTVPEGTQDYPLDLNEPVDFDVTYTVSDGNGETDTATVTIAVGDGIHVVAPPHPVPCAGSTFLIFANLDQAEDITYEIDWDGDGTVDDTIIGPSPITATHTFGVNGTFAITITATDNVTGLSLSAMLSITVEPAGMVGSDVYACGDDLPNRIIASAATGGRVLVRIDDGFYGPFLPGPDGRFFAFEGNDSLDGGDGNDLLFGESGNDQMTGGEGDDVLRGESGNDYLYGSYGNDILLGGEGIDEVNGDFGRDLLIGGAERDLLKGNRDEDILIGGSTDYDDDDDLQDILSIWSVQGESMDVRIGKIIFGFHPLISSTIQNDGEPENPIGGGREGDFFLLSAGDVADDFDPTIDRALPV